MVPIILANGCGGVDGTGCVQARLTRPTKFYSVNCTTQDFGECTVDPNKPLGTLTPKDNAGNTNVFTSTGLWHLNTLHGDPALNASGAVVEVNINGGHYVVDANDASIASANVTC